ncbi:hypothetical protein ACNHKD_15465 [Methylocystis sp. JAN1]|uniref:hypothetical protein n=1 Tax=Methylocystis sp. JAN1 TaxID=3397211 RepID=UPI003FA1A7D4
MRKSLKLTLTGALLGAVTATAVPTEVLAGPIGVAPPATVGLSAPVDRVWYRRWGGYGYRGYGYRPYYGGYYRRYNPGPAVAAGVGLGLLGAGLAASSGGYYGGYYPYYNGGYYPSYGYPAYNYWGW